MLQGKRILITGANGGIGSSIAKILLENHNELVLFYHKDRTQIDKLLQDHKNPKTNVEIHSVDLLKTEDLKETLSKVDNKKIDIFIHTVTLPIIHNKIQNLEWEDYQKHIDLQTKAFFEITKKIIPTMKENKRSRIICILTSYTIGDPPNSISPYIVGKYTLLGLTKCMANELASTGITVNCISPSMTNTPLISKYPRKLIEINAAQNPLGRILESSDILPTILFLCSEKSDSTTGENILINGEENELDLILKNHQKKE